MSLKRILKTTLHQYVICMIYSNRKYLQYEMINHDAGQIELSKSQYRKLLKMDLYEIYTTSFYIIKGIKKGAKK